MKRHPFATLRTLLLLAFTVTFFTACDSVNIADLDEEAAIDAEDIALVASGIAADAGLSTTEEGSLRDRLSQFEREPGWLWYAAEYLQETLTEEQKARLFEKLNQKKKGFPIFDLGLPTDAGFGKHGEWQGPGPFAVMTDEQKQEAREIAQGYKEQIKAIREQVKAGELDRETAKAEIEALVTAMRAEIEGLLTAEQLAELEELKAAAEARWEEIKAAVTAAMMDVLDLTQEEFDALAAMKAQLREDAAGIIEQAKSGDLTREAAREQLEALAAAFEADVATILTAEQIEIVKIHQALTMKLRAKKKHHQHDRRSDRQGGR